METTRSAVEATKQAWSRLLGISASYGLDTVRTELEAVAGPLLEGLSSVEADLRSLTNGAHLAAAAARHLVRGGGKRIRPAVCLLAAQAVGGGDTAELSRLLASVAEAIHSATLLHDDVLDLGEVRRGMVTARIVYGNAASILGGDLLLVRSLLLIERAGMPGLMESVLDVMARMVEAESLQLERRGSAALTLDEYLAIVLGKTASLFEWAASASARAATHDRDDERVRALARYGQELGVAFQVVDDLLDLQGDAGTFGKGLLADVKEGKVTYPMIFALRADPGLAAPLEAAARGEAHDPATLGLRVRAAAQAAGGIDAAQVEIAARTERASAALAALVAGPARDALTAVAQALAERSR